MHRQPSSARDNPATEQTQSPAPAAHSRSQQVADTDPAAAARRSQRRVVNRHAGSRDFATGGEHPIGFHPMAGADDSGSAHEVMSAITFTPSQSKRRPLRLHPAPAIRPTRILVVDEDADLRLLYADVLTPAGYHVAAAAEGAGAWQALLTQRIDLLIIGNRRPTQTGIGLLKKLREARMRLPVILISNRVPVVELNRHPPLKVAATLFLPHTNYELKETVREVLQVSAGVIHPLTSPPVEWANSGTVARSRALRKHRWNLM